MLFRQKDISQGKVDLGSLPLSFVETRPIFGPGEANCCPSQIMLTTYTWAASARVFIKTTEQTVPATG